MLIALIAVGVYHYVKHRIKKMKKIKKLITDRGRLLERLEKNWSNALQRKGVDGLEAMPTEWKSAIITKKSPEGKELEEQLIDMANQIMLAASRANPGKRTLVRNHVSKFIEQSVAPFFAARCKMYRQALLANPFLSPRSIKQTTELFKQIMFLLYDLDNMFKRSYQQRFDLRVVSEMDKWNEWARQNEQESRATDLKQNTSDLFSLYCEAAKIHSCYNAFFKRLAKKTGAEWVPAKLKKIFRILEKAVLQKAESDIAMHTKGGAFATEEVKKDVDHAVGNFDCRKVFDIVRGTLVYHTLTEGGDCLLGGVRALYESKDFQVLRLKDRFNNPTSACWRDVLVNGRMVANDGTVLSHIVEVQFHQSDLRQERLMVAGHHIYERHRALQEACEIACGEAITDGMRNKIRFAMKTNSRSKVYLKSSDMVTDLHKTYRSTSAMINDLKPGDSSPNMIGDLQQREKS